MNVLLKDPQIAEYAVICIQEPWLNTRASRQTHNPTQGNFDVLIVTKEERLLVAFFVNRKFTRKAKVSGRGPLYATIRIPVQIEGKEEEIIIHNVYNPNEKSGEARHREGRYEGLPRESCLPILDGAREKHQGKQQIVVGDFNLHHSRWSGQRDLRSRSSAQTEFLIKTMDRYGLDLCIEPATVTRPPVDLRNTRGNTIDLVWATEELQDRIRTCGVKKDLDCASDHLPVEIVLEFSIQETPKLTQHKFKEMDTQEFVSMLKKLLPRPGTIRNKKDLDEVVDSITKALQEAIDGSVLKATICGGLIPRFTEECREAIDEAKRAKRRWDKNPTEENLRELQYAKHWGAKVISRQAKRTVASR